MPRVHVMVRVPWGHTNASPFCEKVLVYAQLAQIELEEVRDLFPTAGPKGKYPWLEDGETKLGDSQAIVEHLQARHDDPLGDRALPEAVTRRCHLVRRVFEESLYFALLAERYQDPAVWQRFRKDLGAVVPAGLGRLATPLIRRDIRTIIRRQGYGRHSVEEIRRIAADDFAAVADALGDQSFFAGETPHAIDAIAFGFLSNVFETPIPTPMGALAGAHDNLRAFYDRMRTRLSA